MANYLTTKTKSFMKESKTMLKSMDWKFFGVIILALLLPIVPKILRNIWIAGATSEAYHIYQSAAGIIIFIEVMASFVLIPVFSFINRHSKTPEDTKRKVIIAFFGTLMFGSMGLALMLGIGWPLSNLVATNVSNAWAVPPSWWKGIEAYQQSVYKFYVQMGVGGLFNVLYYVAIAYIVMNKKLRWTIATSVTHCIVFTVLEFLLMSNVVFGPASIDRIGQTLMWLPLIWFFVYCGFLYITEMPSWNHAVATFRPSHYKKDVKAYMKSSVFLGSEMVVWNFLYFLSFVCAVWFVTSPVSTDQNMVFALSTTDVAYWYFAYLPVQACMLVMSAALAKSESPQQDREVVKASMLLNTIGMLISIALIFVFIEGVSHSVLIIDSVSDDPYYNMNEAMRLTRISAYSILPFFLIMYGVYKPLLTYFGITGKGHKALLGTAIGGLIAWGPWIVINIMNFCGVPIYFNFGATIFFYGFGMLTMGILYWIFWMIETPKYKLKGSNKFVKFLNSEQTSERELDMKADLADHSTVMPVNLGGAGLAGAAIGASTVIAAVAEQDIKVTKVKKEKKKKVNKSTKKKSTSSKKKSTKVKKQ